jgi:hypothetical protein
MRRGIECSFRSFDPAPRSNTIPDDRKDSPTSASLQAYTSPSIAPSTPILHGLLDGFPDILRPRFTQLLHHFATETSATITQNASARAAWCAAVPQLTSNHAFVIKGVFAITALHLSRSVTAERERSLLHAIAAAQMNTGLIRYRDSVSNVTAENAEALFLYSVTATSYTLLVTADECHDLLQSISDGSQEPAQREASIIGLIHAVTTILRCFRGVRVILVPCWHQIAKGILSPVINRDWSPYPIPSSPQAVEEDCKLREIETLWMQPGRRYEFWFDILIQALKKLREDFALVSQLIADTAFDIKQGIRQDFDWSATASWLVGAPPGFTNLLEQRKPEAWVILAHYAILASKASKIWWFKDLAPNIVSTAALVLNADMWKWIEWPVSVVGVDLDVLRHPAATSSYVQKISCR